MLTRVPVSKPTEESPEQGGFSKTKLNIHNIALYRIRPFVCQSSGLSTVTGRGSLCGISDGGLSNELLFNPCRGLNLKADALLLSVVLPHTPAGTQCSCVTYIMGTFHANVKKVSLTATLFQIITENASYLGRLASEGLTSPVQTSPKC